MSINPERDTTIEAIAVHIAEHLTNRWQGCVSQVSAFDHVPTDPVAFPHLVVHRTDSRGEKLEHCKGIVRYLIISPTERENLPGLMRAVQLAIAEGLRQYNWRNDAKAIIPDQQFRCRERILGIQNGLIPFCEIEFEFGDHEYL